jgi:uncharacterized membrane protein
VRDFENLEELSSAVQTGLRANDIVWAIDFALAGRSLDEETREFLRAGAQELRQLAGPAAQKISSSRRNTRSLLGSKGQHTVRQVAAELAPQDDKDVSDYMNRLAEVLDQIAAGEKPKPFTSQLEAVTAIFSVISKLMLGQANSIARTRKEPSSWLRLTMTSPSS